MSRSTPRTCPYCKHFYAEHDNSKLAHILCCKRLDCCQKAFAAVILPALARQRSAVPADARSKG